MLIALIRACLSLTLLSAAYPPKDLERELRIASEKIDAVREAAEALQVDGQFEEANAKFLDLFPDGQRSPAQALVLGNVLFNQLPEASYRLHKEAVRAFPDDPAAELEWALEQHRAGEYEAAAVTWAKVCKKSPDQAVYHALHAECLMRTNRIADAVAAWQASEKSSGGKIRDFETLLCELKDRRAPHRERAKLRQALKAGDIAAAEKLLVLDAAFQSNWWSASANLTYLDADIALINTVAFTDKPRQKTLKTFADVVRVEKKQEGGLDKQLRTGGLILDKQTTYPTSDPVLAYLLGVIIESKIKTGEELLTPKLVDRVQQSKEPELWNVACHASLGTDRYRDFAKKGWDATGDSRFAVGYITDLDRTNELTADNPDLLSAIQQFPEDSILAQIRLRRGLKEAAPLKPLLETAIKAEYTKLSPSPSPLGPRPSAAALRIYFSKLAEIIREEKPSKG